MSLIKKMRKQKAVWWAQNTEPDDYGQRTYQGPVEIKCRWEDKIGEFRNAQGQSMPSQARVYVDREMRLGDKLKEGAIDSNTPDSPLEDKEAFEIIGFEKMPNIRASESLLTAYL